MGARSVVGLLVLAACSRPQASPSQNGAPEVKPAAARTKDGKTVPPVAKLAEMKGDAKSGEAVFRDAKRGNCLACHQIREEGKMVGPPLTTISNKLSKEQMYESILSPSASILMGYENWIVKLKNGQIKNGILCESTDDHITLKNTDGEYVDIPAADVEAKKQSTLSVMPDNAVAALTLQELVDLVEYMSQLR